MVIIDDTRVCSECGAYEGKGGYCCNYPGHVFIPITLEEWEKKNKDPKPES